jgi:hypothetical protein
VHIRKEDTSVSISHGPNQVEQRDLLQAGSISYKQAGAITRLTNSRARHARLNGTNWRVLTAITDLTASYSKPFDRTYVALIAEMAGLDRTDPNLKRTKRSLKTLASLGLITYEPGRRNHQPSLFGLSTTTPDEPTVAEESA